MREAGTLHALRVCLAAALLLALSSCGTDESDLPAGPALTVELARELPFSRHELELNREGALSVGQYYHELLSPFLWGSFFLVGFVFCIYDFMTSPWPSDPNGQALRVLKILGAAFLSAVVAFSALSVVPDLRDLRAAAVEGELVRIDRDWHGKGRGRLMLTIGNVTATVRPERPLPVQLGRRYRMYYLPNLKQVLSVENVD